MKWENLIKSLQVFTREIFSGDWEDPPPLTPAPEPALPGAAAQLCTLTELGADSPLDLLVSFVSSAEEVKQSRT